MGDCWFLSALAVIAQRHDLIAKLFLSTAVSPTGYARQGPVHAMNTAHLAVISMYVVKIIYLLLLLQHISARATSHFHAV